MNPVIYPVISCGLACSFLFYRRYCEEIPKIAWKYILNKRDVVYGENGTPWRFRDLQKQQEHLVEYDKAINEFRDFKFPLLLSPANQDKKELLGELTKRFGEEVKIYYGKLKELRKELKIRGVEGDF